MKKTLSAVIIFIFLFSVIAPAFAEGQFGTLELLRGVVVYKLPNQTAWNSLMQKSIELPVGTIIQTKEKSQAIVKFSDGAKVLISEMTLFKIQLKEEKEGKNLFTIRLFGKTFVEVKKDPQNSFKIQTPTALATIRGSKMIVSVEPNLMTNVTSAEGTIEVASTYLYKGTVLYLDGNKVTLETSAGLKKVFLSNETIIAERFGQSIVKPGDRIAVYGREVGNLQAATEPLPAGGAEASVVTFVGTDLPNNRFSTAQQGAWANQAPQTTQIVQPSISIQAGTFTIVPCGGNPLPPRPAPPSTPPDISQASSKTSAQAGAAQGEQASTETGEKTETEKTKAAGTGAAAAGVTGTGQITTSGTLVVPTTSDGFMQIQLN